MNPKSNLLVAAVATGLMGASLSAFGQAFVRNPSFESNWNEVWPHYGPVDEWAGASGVNDLLLDPGGPFHNAGTPVPDRVRVGFKQGNGDVTQIIYGLTPGATYWVQFFYDGRRGGGASQALKVKFDDTVIADIPTIRPSDGPYYFHSAVFSPASDFGTLTFSHTVNGDRTLLLDAVTIVERGPNDVVLRNPSFEASGTIPDVGLLDNLAGWTQTGLVGVDDGSAGYANTGTIPDQELVAFILGEGSLAQTIEGLIVGNDYEIQVHVNASAGTAPRLQIRVGDTVVTDEAVAPGAYRLVSKKFKATATSAELVLAQTRAGGDTLLLDNVRLLGTVKPPLPPMTFAPLASETGPEQLLPHTLTIPAAALDEGPVTIRLASSNPNVARLEGAAADNTLSLTFTPGGATTREFTVRTLRRGTVVINVLEAARIPVQLTPLVNVSSSLVKNPSFEANAVPDFPGYGPILAWQGTGQTGLNASDIASTPAGPFGDNGLVPDRQQVAFIQGNGTLAQEINDLEPGRHYWLQFRYNARACCGERTHHLRVRFAGTQLAEFLDLTPVGDLGETEYYFANVPFTPAASSGLLEFVHEVVSGDASVVLDAVNIVPRAADEIVIQNPSFEASGSPPGVGYLNPFRLAGWTGGPGGYGINVNGEGPFTDNGWVPDQDRAGFVQAGGTGMAQNITGLTPGAPYTLVLGLNARNCCGGTPVARVSFADEVLFEQLVSPVGGLNPYPALYLPFTAAGSEGVLRLEISGAEPAGSDVSLLFDDVHLVPGTRTPPVITDQPDSQTVSAGATVTFEVVATGANLSYQWRRGDNVLRNGDHIAGATSSRLTLTGVTPEDAGTYTVLVSDGLGVIGSEPAELTVEGGTVEVRLGIERLANGNVRLSWPASAAGFVLQTTTALPGGWADSDAAVTTEGDQFVVLIAPTDQARYFRLIQR